MKRYCVNDIKFLPTIRMYLSNRQDNKDHFKFDVSIGDLVSILYIDKIYEIGESKEYAIYGRVIDIKNVDIRTNTVMKKGIFLTIDAGENCKSNILTIDIDNILDIHRYPYKYDLSENPKIIPEDMRDGFFINEINYNQKIDMTVPNDPLVTNNYNKEGENNE